MNDLVREIQAGLAAVNAREAELAERERELERAYAEWHAEDARRREAQQELEKIRESIAVEKRRLAHWDIELSLRQAALTTPTRTASADSAEPAQGARARTRRIVLAAIVSLAAGLGWFVTHPAEYRLVMPLHIVTAAPSRTGALLDHRRGLLDPNLADDAGVSPPLAALWRRACATGRIAVELKEAEGALYVTADLPFATEGRRLLEAVCSTYAGRVAEQPEDLRLGAAYHERVSRREMLASALQTLRQSAAEVSPAGALATDVVEPLQAAVDDLQTELESATAGLNERRAALAALVASEPPRREIAPSAVDEALAADSIYAEDQQEFRAVAAEYRTELAVAMLQLLDPLRNLAQALEHFSSVLSEQQRLDPPSAIRAVLEQCQARLTAVDDVLPTFAGQWHSWIDTVQSMDAPNDARELITRQNDAADAARRAGDLATALLHELNRQIQSLDTAGEGRTREVVVAAVLRSEHTPLVAAVNAFTAAAAGTSLPGNIELDTRDRKLRGLQMRMSQRRELAQQQLQLAADAAAREAHAAQAEESRTQVRALEERRDELVTQLVQSLRRLREAHETARRQDEATVRAQRRAQERAWLEERLAILDRELAELRASAQPDQVQGGEVTVTPSSPGRIGQALLVAAAGFAVTWLVSVASSPPQARRRSAGPTARKSTLVHREMEKTP